MKIVTINGQNHKGSTYNAGRMLAEKVGGEIKEFFLPRDFKDYCVGCGQCFMVGEEKCPHFEAQQEILKAMDEADLIILTSPVYVYHVTAPMKNFLDHQGYRWMVHRPRPAMFKKQAVCISTAAGGGMKSTNKDMKDSFHFWGVGRYYSYGKAVFSINWTGVKQKKRDELDQDMEKLAKKIKRNAGNVKPGLKTKATFYVMRFMQKHIGLSETDVKYWKEQGWLEKKRPWK